MTPYIKTPLQINGSEEERTLDRPLHDDIARLDNLVELVIFTPRGSFPADPDFGFEYWNHEYSNVHFREFNNEQKTLSTEVTRQACIDSVRDSLATYEPALKHVEVSVELSALSLESQLKRKTKSKYEVMVRVDGELDNGLGTMRPYSKTISFLMEPTVKK